MTAAPLTPPPPQPSVDDYMGVVKRSPSPPEACRSQLLPDWGLPQPSAGEDGAGGCRDPFFTGGSWARGQGLVLPLSCLLAPVPGRHSVLSRDTGLLGSRRRGGAHFQEQRQEALVACVCPRSVRSVF